MRVRMSPGSTSTADTPCSRSSAARVRVNSSNAALVAPYGPHPGYADVAASLVMLTISPRRSTSSGRASCVRTIGAPTLTGNSRLKLGTSNAWSGPIGPSADALLTSTFRPPSCRAASIMLARTCASVMSPAIGRTTRASADSSAAASSRAPRSRPPITRL